MGIKGLHNLLTPHLKKVHISQFKGETLALDVNCFLYKGLYGCPNKIVEFVMKFVQLLITNKIKPILVLDGKNLPSKAATQQKRTIRKEDHAERSKKLLGDGRFYEAGKLELRSSSLSRETVENLIQATENLEVDLIVAPFEADAELAYLSKNGFVDGVITEDSDISVFGVDKILFKFQMDGFGLLYQKTEILSHLQLTFEQFRSACILGGCDYLENLKNIGIKKATDFFQSQIVNEDQFNSLPMTKSLLNKIPEFMKMQNLKISEDYAVGFSRAYKSFKYQIVFDPKTRIQKRLESVPEGVTDLDCCGHFIEESIALQHALGNLDIKTLKKIGNKDPDCTIKSSIWNKISVKSNCTKKKNLNDQEVLSILELESPIKKIEKSDQITLPGKVKNKWELSQSGEIEITEPREVKKTGKSDRKVTNKRKFVQSEEISDPDPQETSKIETKPKSVLSFNNIKLKKNVLNDLKKFRK